MIDHLKNPGYLNLQTHNAPLTSHHHNIINTALSDNTLVHSVSDWDATIIAADLTRQFYTKNASGKVILMSTSSEWINQLSKYLTGIIPSDAIIHLTGTKDNRKRDVYWSEKRVFLASPSIVFNDIKFGKCLVWHIRHFVLHEAHKAKGNHSYCRIVSHLNDMNYNDYKILAISNKCTKNFNTVITKLKPHNIISWAKNGINETAASVGVESTPQARNPTTAIYQIPETQQNVTMYGSNHAHKALAPSKSTPQAHFPTTPMHHISEAQHKLTSYGSKHVEKALAPFESTPQTHFPTTPMHHISEAQQKLTSYGSKHVQKADCQNVLPRRLFASGSKPDNRTVNIRNSISEEKYRQSSSRKYHERELIPKRKEYWAMSTATFKNIKRPDEKEISLTISHKTSHNCNSIKPSKDSQILAELLQFNDTLRLRMSSSNQNPSVDVAPDKEPTVIVAQTNLSSYKTTETPFSDSWLPSTSGLQIYPAPSALITKSKSPTNSVRYVEKKLPITAAEVGSKPNKKPTTIVAQSNQSSPRTKEPSFDANQKTSTSGLQKDVSLSVPVTNSTESPSNAASYIEEGLPMMRDCRLSKVTVTSFSDNQQPSTSRREEKVLSSASVINSNIETCTKAARDVELQIAAAPIVEDCTSHQSPPLSLKKRKRIRQHENDISATKINRDNRDYPKIEQICNLLDNLSNVTKKHCYICTNDSSECSLLQELRKSSVVESLKHLQIPDINLIDNVNADTILNSVNHFNKINGEFNHSKIYDKSIGEYGVKTTLRMQTSIGITEKQATPSNTKLTVGSSIDTNLNSVSQSDKKVKELNNNNVNKSEKEIDIDDLLAELNEYHTEKTKDTEFIEEDMTSNMPTEQSISGPASSSPGGLQEEDNSPEQSNIVERPLSTLKSSDRPQIEDNFSKQSNNFEHPRSPLMSSEWPQLEDNYSDPPNILERARSPLMTSDRPQLEDNYPDQSNIHERARSPLISSDRPQLENNYSEPFNILERARTPLMTSDRPQLEDNYSNQSNIFKHARSLLMTSDRPQSEHNYLERNNILKSPLMSPDNRPQMGDNFPEQFHTLESSLLNDKFTTPDGLKIENPLISPDQVEDNFSEPPLKRKYSLSTIRKCSSKIHPRKQPRIG